MPVSRPLVRGRNETRWRNGKRWLFEKAGAAASRIFLRRQILQFDDWFLLSWFLVGHRIRSLHDRRRQPIARAELSLRISFKQLIETRAGYSRFWSEWEIAFDEPFRPFVIHEFAKKAATQTPPDGTAPPKRTDRGAVSGIACNAFDIFRGKWRSVFAERSLGDSPCLMEASFA